MTGSTADRTRPTVRILSTEECLERLATATVGRVGFVTPQGLQILPLNYRVTGASIVLRTTPNSSLSQLAEMGAAVTFEVDEHDDSATLVWSVMVQGALAKLPRVRDGEDGTASSVPAWPGRQFGEALELTPTTYRGRVLHHPPAAVAAGPR